MLTFGGTAIGTPCGTWSANLKLMPLIFIDPISGGEFSGMDDIALPLTSSILVNPVLLAQNKVPSGANANPLPLEPKTLTVSTNIASPVVRSNL